MHGEPPTRPSSRLTRLLWFIGLWAGSVAAIVAVAYLLRAIIVQDV